MTLLGGTVVVVLFEYDVNGIYITEVDFPALLDSCPGSLIRP